MISSNTCDCLKLCGFDKTKCKHSGYVFCLFFAHQFNISSYQFGTCYFAVGKTIKLQNQIVCSFKIPHLLKKNIHFKYVIKMTLKWHTFQHILFSCYPGVVTRQKGKVDVARQMATSFNLYVHLHSCFLHVYFNSMTDPKIFLQN